MSYIKPIITSLIVAPMLALTSCSKDSKTVESRKEVLGELMDNKPIRQFETVMEGFDGYDSFMKESKVQSSLDSVAYGDVFKKTSLAQDEAASAEFRAIAEQTRPDLLPDGGYDEVSDALDEKIKDLNISKKSYEANQKEYSKMTKHVSKWLGGSKQEPLYDKIIATKQFKADSVAYRRFFKRYDLLKEVKSELKEVAKRVRP